MYPLLVQLLMLLSVLFQTGNPETDRATLKALILFVLFAVPALAVKNVTDWIIAQLDDRPGVQPVSPRTQRWIAWGVSAALPTVLYLAYTVGLSFDDYHVETHLLAILAAFGVSQIMHGQQLPNGTQVRQLKAEKQGTVVKPLHGLVYVTHDTSVVRVGDGVLAPEPSTPPSKVGPPDLYGPAQ
jgi:hypothetical protein